MQVCNVICLYDVRAQMPSSGWQCVKIVWLSSGKYFTDVTSCMWRSSTQRLMHALMSATGRERLSSVWSWVNYYGTESLPHCSDALSCIICIAFAWLHLMPTDGHHWAKSCHCYCSWAKWSGLLLVLFWNITTATILQPLYSSTCYSWTPVKNWRIQCTCMPLRIPTSTFTLGINC